MPKATIVLISKISTTEISRVQRNLDNASMINKKKSKIIGLLPLSPTFGAGRQTGISVPP